MSQSNKGRKILVIDDDPTLIALIKGVLEAHDFEPLLANEAPLGLEMAIKQSPDLIILDVMMPIINGYNICRLMKTESGHKKIPIILLTSRAEEADRKIGEEVGADGYISKPFETQHLIQMINSLLSVYK